MSDTTTTPSGIVIELDAAAHKYLVDGARYPSVTTILRMIDKPALLGWVERVTLEGPLALGKIGVEIPKDLDDCKELLKAHGLRYYQVRDQAATRGTSIHDAAERLATDGTVPDLADFPPEDRGYVMALCSWWLKYEPKVIDTEVLVASPTHRFAGRFDLFCEIQGVTHRIDWKSGKAIYDEAWLQLGAYEIAAQECGYPEATCRAIVRLDESGEYEFQTSGCDPELFLRIVDAYRALAEVRRSKPKKPRQKKVAA